MYFWYLLFFLESKKKSENLNFNTFDFYRINDRVSEELFEAKVQKDTELDVSEISVYEKFCIFILNSNILIRKSKN